MTLAIHLDRASQGTLQDQLFEQLRGMILNGVLKPHARVVATRSLADQTGVSRTTALLAYERLINEGYLESRGQVGTFVSGSPPRADGNSGDRREPCHAADPSLDERPTSASSAPRVADFSARETDGGRLLSEKALLAATRAVLQSRRGASAPSAQLAGAGELRRIIADRLAASRGVNADPEDIIVVSGRRQACALLAHALIRRGDRVVVETPGEPDAVALFHARGADLRSVPVDARGLDPRALPDTDVKLAYVTPTRQSALGVRLSAPRRASLLDWARRSGAILIEDEADGEIAFDAPPPPLAAEDRERVVFMGGFSHSLGPGLGLGFLVAPRALVETMLAIRGVGDEGVVGLDQLILAELLAGEAYDRHLRRVRKSYLERRDALVERLREHLPNARILGEEGGCHIVLVLPDGCADARDMCEAARRAGVRAEAVLDIPEDHPAPSVFHDRAVILGYGLIPPDRIGEGVDRFVAALAPSNNSVLALRPERRRA